MSWSTVYCTLEQSFLFPQGFCPLLLPSTKKDSLSCSSPVSCCASLQHFFSIST